MLRFMASAVRMSKVVTKEHLLAVPAIRSLLQQDFLVDLYIFADSIVAPAFQNHIMDSLLQEMQGAQFSYDVVGRIYDSLCENSPLRAVYVQAMAVQASSALFKKVVRALPPDFIADVALRKFEREEGIGAVVSPWAEVLNRSAYCVRE